MTPQSVARELLTAGIQLVGPSIVGALRELIARHDAGEPLPEPQRVEPVGAGALVGDLVNRLSKESRYEPR